MNSFTKRDFSDTEIELMVRSILGDSAEIQHTTPLTAGWFNTAYAIKFASPHPYMVLRIAPDSRLRMLQYEKDLMRLEVIAYQLLQDKDSEVYVPDLYGYNFDRTVVPHDFMLISEMLGFPYGSRTLNDQNDPYDRYDVYMEDLGQNIAQLRKITNDWFGLLDGKFRSGSWRTTFLAMIGSVLEDGESFKVMLPYAEMRDLIAAAAPALDEIMTPTLVHWDLWGGNVFVQDVSIHGHVNVMGIIDWERAFWGDRAMESMLPCVEGNNAIWAGLGESMEIGATAEIRRSLYRLYLQLVMVVEDKVRFGGADHLEKTNHDLHQELEKLAKLV
ncbi:MAG: aminoglycoside phosphotransferase family protein [Chloroflexota bacterium]